VKITSADTFISGPGGNSKEIQHRIDELKTLISQTSTQTTLMILKVS